MDTTVVDQPLTLQEFLAGEHESYKFVEGKLVPMVATKVIYGKTSTFPLRFKGNVEVHKQGELYTNETVFQFDNRAREPDVAFVSKNRVPVDPWTDFHGAPDLAIEATSPTDALKDIHEKAFEYLDAGSQLVWVVEPFSQTVMVYRSRLDIRLLTLNDVLTSEDVVEGFSCPVADLFQ